MMGGDPARQALTVTEDRVGNKPNPTHLRAANARVAYSPKSNPQLRGGFWAHSAKTGERNDGVNGAPDVA
jgi:hypothetical protein